MSFLTLMETRGSKSQKCFIVGAIPTEYKHFNIGNTAKKGFANWTLRPRACWICTNFEKKKSQKPLKIRQMPNVFDSCRWNVLMCVFVLALSIWRETHNCVQVYSILLTHRQLQHIDGSVGKAQVQWVDRQTIGRSIPVHEQNKQTKKQKQTNPAKISVINSRCQSWQMHIV